jgi:hypothetical protein
LRGLWIALVKATTAIEKIAAASELRSSFITSVRIAMPKEQLSRGRYEQSDSVNHAAPRVSVLLTIAPGEESSSAESRFGIGQIVGIDSASNQ